MPGDKRISGETFVTEPERFDVQTIRRSVQYDFEDVPPGRGCYLTEEDFIVVSGAVKSAAVSCLVNYKLLTPDNRVVTGQQQVQFGNGLIASGRFQLAEGFLLSLAVLSVSPYSQNVYTFATVAVQRMAQGNANNFEVLAYGAFSQLAPLCYPQGVPQRGPDGAGFAWKQAISAPAAGAELSFTIPLGERWRVLGLRASLTTAVAVANRQVQLVTDNGATIDYATQPGPVQVASLTWAYTFAPFGYAPVLTLLEVSAHYDDGIVLVGGDRIRTVTTNIQGADQWSAGQVRAIVWPDFQS